MKYLLILAFSMVKDQFSAACSLITSMGMALCLLFPVTLFAQLETTWWYMPDSSGLNFSLGSPVPDTSAKLYFGVTGCSMSDSLGNLLYYTDSDNLWNAYYEVMPNGTGLLNSQGSNESLLTVPRPNTPDHYYVFVARSAYFMGGPTSPNPGTIYHEIDMGLDGGLGDIIPGMKNVPLTDSTEEKICGTRHANGTDYWVMVAQGGTNQFQAFQVTENGVSSNPVTTNIGFTSTTIANCQGNLQFNHRGTMLAHVHTTASNYVIELYDFDNASGILSNLRTITYWGAGHGIEFSLDDSKLYVGGPEQFDLSVPTQSAIQSSQEVLFQMPVRMQGLQMGLDGIIYGYTWSLAGSAGYMSAIHNSNASGVNCNYQDSAIYMLGRKQWTNPPKFMSSYFAPAIIVSSGCEGDSIGFRSSPGQLDSVQWNFGNPGSGTANTSTLFNPSHLYSAPGGYTVTLIAHTGVATDTIVKTVQIKAVPDIDLGPDTSVCTPLSDSIQLGASTGTGTYSWNTGQSDSSIWVNTAGSYILTFTNACGSDVDTFYVVSIESPIAGLLAPDSLCIDEDTLFLDVTQSAALSYLWSDNSTSGTYMSTQSGWHSVTITGVCDTVNDSIHVVFYLCPWPEGVDQSGDESLSIFPNPTSGILKVRSDRNGRLCIGSIYGQMLRNFKIQGGNDESAFKLELPPGLYRYQFLSNGIFRSGIIVIQ